MATEVHGTGAIVRLATDDEVRTGGRLQHGLDLAQPRSYTVTHQSRPLASDEVYVVSQTFVDFADDRGARRWVGCEHHGCFLPVSRDATLELLELTAETEDDLLAVMADMRIAGLGVTRWQIMSAPRRLELAPDLETRLAPLQRG